MAPILSSIALVATLLSILTQATTLFEYEKIQLTEEILKTYSEEDKETFGFGNSKFVAAAAPNKTSTRCRYGPDDGKYPSDKAWTNLGKKLSSPANLIKAVPQSSVCWGDTKDDAQCQQLTANWTNSYTHIDDPVEILSPVYQGLTCQPPTIYNSNGCTLGGYPSYVASAKTTLDIQVSINFARNNLVRLVVKNTGHDFAGKSAGAGALSIWTHGLKDMQFFDNYIDESGYKGPAIKAGAGVQAFELYKFANEHGVVAVAGEGQTVGVFGGYIQGGGHSPLSSMYGMAADHVLGFEIVTPTGEFATANSTSNQDLFWALRGGGGGTFGVVTSVTVKVYPDLPVTAASWSFNSTNIGKDKFWQAVRAWIDRFNINADAGIYNYFTIVPAGPTTQFVMQPYFAPNKTLNDTYTLLRPFFNQLQSLNIPTTQKVTNYKSFYPAWQAEFPLEAQSDVQTAFGSRLFPRSNFESDTSRKNTWQVLKDTVESSGQMIIGFNMAPTLARGGNVDNAVNPAWRTSVFHAITGRRWNTTSTKSDILAARKSFTNGTMQRWRDATPGSGSYLNEADRLEPNWQQSFWGDKYARLLSIKKDIDKKNVLWANNAVGSENMTVESVDGLPNENGKLCSLVEPTTTSRIKSTAPPTATPTAAPALRR